MRALITEFYSMCFKYTRSKLFSYIFGIVYISVLNYIIVHGLSLLLREWLPAVGMALRLFKGPVGFVTAALFVGLTYWLTPPVQTIAKDAKKNTRFTTIMLYTLFGAVLFAYIRYGESFFS